MKGVGMKVKKVSKKEMKIQMKGFKTKTNKTKAKSKKGVLKMQTIKKGKRLKEMATL